MKQKRPLKVLMIDDDATARHHLSVQMRRLGYQVVSVSSPEEARDLLVDGGSAEFDCVVTDCWMPDETGLDVLQWLRRCDSTLASVVVSGDAEKELITQSLRGGASDFVEKPVSLNELAAALDKGVRSTLRRRENVTTEKVLRQVGILQQRLNGFNLMGGLPLDIVLCNYPQHEAGGDSTAFFLTPRNELLAIVMDVSGHDLRSAIISAYFQGMLRGNVDAGEPLEQILENFNSYLVGSWTDLACQAGSYPGITSLAVCAIRWDMNTNEVAIINSGFPHPFLASEDGTARYCGTDGSYPLGWFEPNPLHEMPCQARPGDIFLVWTDGLADLAESLDVTPLSLAYRLVQAERQGIRSTIVEDATDDILVVSIQVPSPAVKQVDYFPIVAERYTPAELGQIDSLQNRWKNSLHTALPVLPEQLVLDILLCCREAVVNALLHGCAAVDPFVGKAGDICTVRVSANRFEDHLEVVVSDNGPGHCFDVEAHTRAAAEELLPLHRGLILIHQVPDRTVAENNGTVLRMYFSLQKYTSAAQPPSVRLPSPQEALCLTNQF